jgi:hypothetical protein
MNFYSNKLGALKYFNILNNYKSQFSKKFLLKNNSSFMGDKALFKLICCYEMIKKTKNIEGDIIEFGVWNGNNLLALKKILDLFKLKKKIFGFDHFRGMPSKMKDSKRNNFRGNIKLVKYFIKFFKLQKVNLINDNILNLKKYLKKFKKISLIYIDCDIYETTKIILENLSFKLSVGGIIAFDEGNQKNNSGETRAMREFYKKNKKYYKRILLKKGYQPDIYLVKVK